MAGWKILKTRCSGSSVVIITRKEMINRRDKEACMGVIPKKFYQWVLF